MSWKNKEYKVDGEDEFVLVLPENYEEILGEFLSAMIVSIQQLSSVIRGIPSSSPEEVKRREAEFRMINDLRAAYSTLARWNRLNGTIGRTTISGQEYWDFVSQVSIFPKMYKLGDYPSDLSLTGFMTPPVATTLRRKTLWAWQAMEKKFTSPLFIQLETLRQNATS